LVDARPPQKLCFIIRPIGDADTPIRDNSDMLVDLIIAPVLEPRGYRVERADRIASPGTITDQVINHVLDAELVIADLTGHNPNAFYELGLRHREAKPTIHMITKGQHIPFDVSDSRAVEYSLRNPRLMDEARKELDRKVEATEKANYKESNPITRARGIRRLSESADSNDQLVAELLRKISELQTRVEGAEATANIALSATGAVPNTTFTGTSTAMYSPLVAAVLGTPGKTLLTEDRTVSARPSATEILTRNRQRPPTQSDKPNK
jgi:hypothetical protein